jgi:uncharacterized hydrophobic protein (TIGR00271 family)
MTSPIAVTDDDVARITSRLFLTEGDRTRNLSAFWVLLCLAAVIASAGVVADSTATVIGAMIVAPLMTPILGTALALVLADRRQMIANVLLVLGGGLAVIVIGYLIGLTVQVDVVAATNSQVAGRVSPRLIDLLAALATGFVGAFALLRADVSDTLPGVAIAISLVPPLAVVGLTLESGAGDEALGALLLFGTNVAAIVGTGTLLLLIAGLRSSARTAGRPIGELRGTTLVVVAAMLVVVAVPLTLGSGQAAREQWVISQAGSVAEEWADGQHWQVQDVAYRQGALWVVAVGQPPEADEDALRQALDDAGLADVTLEVTLLYGGSDTLPATK